MSIHNITKSNITKNNITNIEDLIQKHNTLNKEIDTLLTEVDGISNCDITYLINLLINHNIHSSWFELFIEQSPILINTMRNIDLSRQTLSVYPPSNLTFKVFETDINSIKIVLLGQDPYIKKGQAIGLSFSVPDGVTMPPSLHNIFKELKEEFPERKYKFDKGGNLTKWSESGMFLLNSALTVIENKSNSQQSLWSNFTDKVIEYINMKRTSVVFLLLGLNAASKKKYIDNNVNHIITGVHPSPLSAYNGFFKSDIFKKVEEKLQEEFDWQN
jgi:uracil-DNA glycosylase